MVVNSATFLHFLIEMRTRFDILTPKDKKVLEILNKDGIGLTSPSIAKIMDVNKKSVYNSLNRLIKHNFLVRIGKSPAIYKIDLKSNNVLIYVRVKCPKCNSVRPIDLNQSTAICNVCGSRFRITKNRILFEGKVVIKGGKI